MAKSKLNFNNPLLSPAAVGSLPEAAQDPGKEKSEPAQDPAPEERERKKKKKGGAARIPNRIRNENGGNSTQEGLAPENTRFSCICKVENVKRVKDYAYTNRITIMQAMNEIIESFFEDYEGDLLDYRKGNE